VSITTLICDFDGVMSGYEARHRLDALAGMCGLERDDVHGRLWLSGFEDGADAGSHADPGDYLAAFCDNLGETITRAQWIKARLAAMQHWPDMHELIRHVSARARIALLTNNGPLTREAFAELAPHTQQLFEPHLFFSYQFRTKKPDPAIFRAVAERLGVSPAECLFVDDKLHNAKGASKAGMTGVHFTGAADFKAVLADAGLLEHGA
jgi:glucose-1-phosphatase